ncbi:thiamine phosphate synthase, partial [Crocinitomix sp.]|nr:thiamine phosphate synthase [Crocinitomix sp.]
HLQVDDLNQFSEDMMNGVDAIRIPATIPKAEILNLIARIDDTTDLLIIDDIQLALELNVKGVFFSNPESYNELRNFDQDLLLGGMAHNLADCKNWEMIGADFIDYNPPIQKEHNSPLGSEGFQELPSKNEVYGWMLFSLNVPVFVHHPTNLTVIQSIVEFADVQGTSLSANFDWGQNATTTLNQIRNLLNAV